MESAAVTLNESTWELKRMHWVFGEMKGVSARRGEMAESPSFWRLVVLPVARIYIDNQNSDLSMPTHQSWVQEGLWNLQCSTVGERGLVQFQCYFLLSSEVCFRLKMDLAESFLKTGVGVCSHHRSGSNKYCPARNAFTAFLLCKK